MAPCSAGKYLGPRRSCEVFHVVVLGAGVAGKAALEKLLTQRCKVAVVEQNEEVIAGLNESKRLKVYVGRGRVVSPGRVEVAKPEGRLILRTRAIIIATGKCSEHGLGVLGVEMDEQGFLRVDDRCRTKILGLFAAGDATGPPFTQKKAIEEGNVAALAALAKPARVRFEVYHGKG